MNLLKKLYKHTFMTIFKNNISQKMNVYFMMLRITTLKLMIMTTLEKKVYPKNIVLIQLFKWVCLWILLVYLCAMGYSLAIQMTV